MTRTNNAPPHVLIVSPGGKKGAGGISRMVMYLSAEYSKMPNRFSYEIVDSYGGTNYLLQLFKFITALLYCCVRGLTGRVSVAHIHASFRGSTLRKYFFCLLFKMLKIPVILHLHGSQFDLFVNGLPPFLRNRVKNMFAGVDRVIVLGEDWKNFVCSAFDLDRNRVSVVHNGTPPLSFACSYQQDRPLSIIFLGRLGDRKGVPELVKALSQLDHREKWHAIIAGDGEVDRFIKMAQDLNISDQITFPGWVGQEEVLSILKDADIFVLASHNEGLPVSILEAMSCGLPIVASDVGAITEALDDEVSGLIIKPGNVDNLAHALGRLVTDQQLRQKIGQAAKERFDTGFDITICAKNTSNIYLEVAGSKSRPRP